MARELEQALGEGAAGLSSGLEYAPGLWAPPTELVALARVAARAGKLYASHMRSEDARLLEAVAETLELARASGCRVQISHLKACGRANWPKLGAALEAIERAVREGHDVRADMYPYTAYSTGLSILLPGWAREGGSESLLARLADPAQRARVRAELIERVANEPGGFDLIAIASELDGASRGLSGQTLAALGARWGMEPADACLRLLEEQRGAVSYVGHAMQESDVARVLAHPLVLVGSDGSVQPLADESGSKPHPRSFGAAARVLGRFVRELGQLDLPSAVRKLAALPAERVRLEGRGRVERGFHADLVVFDPARVADLATFEDPRRAPAGIEHVLVAGQPVVERGRHTGARPGRVL
jgi:N-acyl-D-aspartate/D-glutamate deacylase